MQTPVYSSGVRTFTATRGHNFKTAVLGNLSRMSRNREFSAVADMGSFPHSCRFGVLSSWKKILRYSTRIRNNIIICQTSSPTRIA